MVTCRAVLDVLSDLVSWLENLMATRRSEAGGTRRALTAWEQAVVTLVRLTKGETSEQLGRHPGIGTQTARRYANESVEALAPRATLAQAPDAAGGERRLLPGGTLIPTWRCAALATEANPGPAVQRQAPRARHARARADGNHR